MRSQLAALLTVSAACGGDAPPVDSAPPNVIVITLDTLRADFLSCYGFGKVTSPRLDALSGKATLFERCLSTAPWTAPAHASLFTGRHPFEHGVYSWEADRMGRNVYPLPEEAETLAEKLSEEGYTTAGIVTNNAYLAKQFRIQQGFETWDVQREYADRVRERTLAWIDQRDAQRPFFLFLNFMDTHRPYNTVPQPGEEEFDEPSGTLLNQLIEQVMERGEEPDPDLVARLQTQYERSIRNLDRELGRLFDALEERDLFDSALILITSDHGEYFGEHQLVEHSKDVYDAALRVPMIVKYPRQKNGERVETPVSVVHAPRLITEGLPSDLRQRVERTFPYEPGAHPLLAENHFSRSKDLLNKHYGSRFRRIRTVLYEGGYKYIESSDGENELYDLGADPKEGDNRIESDPQKTAAMAESLRRFRAQAEALPQAEALDEQLSAREFAELQALGYVDGEEEQ